MVKLYKIIETIRKYGTRSKIQARERVEVYVRSTQMKTDQTRMFLKYLIKAVIFFTVRNAKLIAVI